MLEQKVQNANSRSERPWGQVCTQTRHTIDPHAASWHQLTVPWSCGLATVGPEQSNASCESRVKPLQWLNLTQLWGGHFRPICPHTRHQQPNSLMRHCHSVTGFCPFAAITLFQSWTSHLVFLFVCIWLCSYQWFSSDNKSWINL